MKHTAHELATNPAWIGHYEAFDGARSQTPCRIRLTRNQAAIERFKPLAGGKIKTITKYVDLNYLIYLRKI